MTFVSLRAAILGFLDLQPTTGYSLRQRFEGSVASFWSVTQSQIYRELHALEKEGLVTSQIERGDGKPDRKVYELTDQGRESLHRWLEEPLEPLQLRHPLLLKFVFSADVPPRALDTLLSHYEDGLSATREEYTSRLSSKEIFALARSKREAKLWTLSIEHGLAWCEAELAWVQDARRRLAEPESRGRRKRHRNPDKE